MTREKIIHQANTIRQQKGYVDVVQLARDAGIDIVGGVDASTENAHISYDQKQDKYHLWVNQNHAVSRQRFSIAHELAHYVLHRTELRTLGQLARAGSSRLEQEADELAADILMPQGAVETYFNIMKIDPTDITLPLIKRLSEHFRVSKEVIILRLREFGYHVPYISFS